MQPDTSTKSKYPPDDFDYVLMRDGALSLFHKPSALQAAISWFQERLYDVRILDAHTWQQGADFHSDVARVLNFPDYKGNSLDALNDFVTDMDIPANAGMVVVFLHFDAFLTRHPKLAISVMDIFADATWYFLVQGKKLLILLQSDKPDIQLKPVGCRYAVWHPGEWLNKDRGL
jgi:RNAse (barnase) inhibitor barstar